MDDAQHWDKLKKNIEKYKHVLEITQYMHVNNYFFFGICKISGRFCAMKE